MIGALAAVVCLANPTVVPVEGRVADWFRRPDCGWCAGNRGLEFVASPGAYVRIPVEGVVSFVGPVGGEPYVVVRTSVVAGGRPLFAVLGGVETSDGGPPVGAVVAAGQVVGRTPGALFVGFRVGPRRDNAYLDPAPLLGIVRKSARLVAGDPLPVSLSRRPGSRTEPTNTNNQRHCSSLPPVVASAREPGP